jgi:hypothetical protein
VGNDRESFDVAPPDGIIGIKYTDLQNFDELSLELEAIVATSKRSASGGLRSPAINAIRSRKPRRNHTHAYATVLWWSK